MEKIQKTNKSRNKFKTWVVRVVIVTGLAGLCLGCFIWYANAATAKAGEGIIYDDVECIKGDRVALVFGCNSKFQGRDNLYFKYRIEAASELWAAGKVRGFIVSGDNSRVDYNEPDAMKEALMQRGVPSENIICDYAGLRTFDSVVRAKEVFGLDSVLFVSQRFQNERAQYMAKQCEMNAISYVARDVAGSGGYRTKCREILARPKMVLDFKLLGTTPKYLGKKEVVPF
jgi:SanA protein